MIVFFNQYPEIIDKLIQLAKSRKEVTRYIAYYSSIITSTNGEFAFELLSICATNPDPTIISNVSFSMGGLAMNYPMECLLL
jgi:hypothetical protein